MCVKPVDSIFSISGVTRHWFWFPFSSINDDLQSYLKHSLSFFTGVYSLWWDFYQWEFPRFIILICMEWLLLECHYLLNLQKMSPFLSMQSSTMQFSGGDVTVPSLRLKTNSSKLVRYVFCDFVYLSLAMLRISSVVVWLIKHYSLAITLKFLQPYLHESRHLHALKRARGCGGRFLNGKKHVDSDKATGSAELHSAGNMSESEVHQPENHRDGASTPSCSDITSASNSDDIFQQPEFMFSGYHSHIVGTMQGRWVGTRRHTTNLVRSLFGNNLKSCLCSLGKSSLAQLVCI